MATVTKIGVAITIIAVFIYRSPPQPAKTWRTITSPWQ